MFHWLSRAGITQKSQTIGARIIRKVSHRYLKKSIAAIAIIVKAPTAVKTITKISEALPTISVSIIFEPSGAVAVWGIPKKDWGLKAPAIVEASSKGFVEIFWKKK